MKLLLKLLAVVVALVVIVAVIGTFAAGPVVKTAVEKFGPAAVGVPVELDDVGINLMQGRVRLEGLRVGNPEGFQTEQAFSLGEVAVHLRPGSVFSDRIEIVSILIREPELTYELRPTGSNLGAIKKGLEKEAAAPAEEEAGEKPGAGKSVSIGLLTLEGGKVHVSGPLMQGRSMTVALPPVELKDIGGGGEKTGWAEVLNRVMTVVLKETGRAATEGSGAVGDLLKQSGELSSDALKGAGEALKGAGESAGENVKKTLGGLLRKATGEEE
ncbi:AsmA family protein [Kiritimatiella glycovorans]|uniref:Uncharacterized protein n=1 Tax=Kiritimatiella glycovorans TaxID=1307763 RepID=A0A0G3EAH7_9BACT|nr:AsmA family protein [Kiritimatiella glycovorans]AKJ63298.1 putative protein involved in outer membrane biogenesis [Kiritimatiella glycovorans]